MKVAAVCLSIGSLLLLSDATGTATEFLKYLNHFNENELSQKMRQYELPADIVCSQEARTCLKNIHQHLMKCMNIREGDEAEYTQECRKNDIVFDVKSKDELWQKASFKFHKAMQQCINEEPLPEAAETEASYLRKKRQAGNEEEEVEEEEAEQCRGDQEEYTDLKECLNALKRHKPSCAAKITDGCPILNRCQGKGAVPEDEDQAAWYNYVKALREDSEREHESYTTALNLCIADNRDLDGDLIEGLDEDMVNLGYITTTTSAAAQGEEAGE